MQKVAYMARQGAAAAANTSLIAEVDRRLNRVRDGLAALEATGADSCDPADVARRADALLSVPQMRGLVVTNSETQQTCASLPLRIEPAPAFVDLTRDLSSFEHLDVVTVGPNGRLAFRLSRRLMKSVKTFSAIVPLARLFTDLDGARGTTSESSTADASRHISLGRRALVDVAGEPTIAPTAPALPRLDDASGSVISAGDQVVAQSATSASYPVTVTSVVPPQSDARLRMARLLTDLALGAVGVAVLLIVFFREPGRDFAPSRFDQAIRRNEFEVIYRPIIELTSGKVSGALVQTQWHRPGDIVLPASDFMPAVVRSGYELEMVQFALTKCFADLAQVYKLRPRLSIKIAIDHQTVIRPGFIDQLRRTLASSQMRPSQLIVALFPIGEANNPERSRLVMRELQRLGVGLEIRQSTGDISFGAASHDPVATSAAIDVRLMQALGSHEPTSADQARVWIRSLVTLGAAAGVRIYAPLVRNFETLRELKRLGVDEAEGEILSPILSAGSYMALIALAGLDQGEANQSTTIETTAQRRQRLEPASWDEQDDDAASQSSVTLASIA